MAKLSADSHSQAPGLLHSHQAGSEPAYSDDHVGGLLSCLPRAVPDCRLGEYVGGHASGCQRNCHAESMDGTCVGRPDAPHREPASTFGTSQHTRSVSVWPSVERCRRSLSGDHRKFIVSIFGSLDAAVVSADLYAIEAENPLCTLLGAFPGAMPTLIGWAGSSNGIDRHAWYLFSILFLWQFPHFLAIALMYRDDYARAGYRMLPDFDLDSRFTRAEIVGFTLVLIVTTMLPLVGRGGPIYVAGMLLAGIFMLYHVAKLAQSTSKALASRVVHASVIYLPVVLLIMVTHKG